MSLPDIADLTPDGDIAMHLLALGEWMDGVVEAVAGHREKLLKHDFSESMAERACIDYHQALLAMLTGVTADGDYGRD